MMIEPSSGFKMMCKLDIDPLSGGKKKKGRPERIDDYGPTVSHTNTPPIKSSSKLSNLLKLRSLCRSDFDQSFSFWPII